MLNLILCVIVLFKLLFFTPVGWCLWGIVAFAIIINLICDKMRK